MTKLSDCCQAEVYPYVDGLGNFKKKFYECSKCGNDCHPKPDLEQGGEVGSRKRLGWYSKCHNAVATVYHGDEGTNSFQCFECGGACDAYWVSPSDPEEKPWLEHEEDCRMLTDGLPCDCKLSGSVDSKDENSDVDGGAVLGLARDIPLQPRLSAPDSPPVTDKGQGSKPTDTQIAPSDPQEITKAPEGASGTKSGSPKDYSDDYTPAPSDEWENEFEKIIEKVYFIAEASEAEHFHVELKAFIRSLLLSSNEKAYKRGFKEGVKYGK